MKQEERDEVPEDGFTDITDKVYIKSKRNKSKPREF